MEGRELPVGWTSSDLGDLVEFLYGKSLPARNRQAGDIPVYGSNGVVGSHSEAIVDAPCIIIGRKGSVGEIHFCDSPSWPIDTTYFISGFGPLLPRFLFFLLKSLGLGDLDRATAIPGLNRQDAYQLHVPVPPFEEQGRISAKLDVTLSAVEACRQRLNGVAAILKRFRQAVLAAATSGELTRAWREEMESSREGWLMIQTKEAGKIQLGRQRSPKYHHGPTMRPYLRVQNVFEDRIDLSDVMEMDFSGADLEKYTLHPGDILLNEGQSPQYLGRPAMYRGELPGSCFTNSLIRFQAGSNVLPHFALLVFRDSMHAGRYVEQGTITTNIAHLSAGRFGEVAFPLPPVLEQQEIVRRAQELFTLADQLEAKLTAARKLVDRLTPALLAKAFRGVLVPQDPNDEPASVLLERIRAARQAEAAGGKPSRRGRRKAAASPGQAPLAAAPAPSDLLAQLLQECGALSERALLAASELDPAGFRAQLALEQGMGVIRETAQDGQVLLEVVG